MNTNNTIPVANNISWWVPYAYPTSKAILVVKGLILDIIESGTIGELPATNITAIVSPIALPIPSTTAANIPDFAAGKITLNIVSVWDAPRPKEPSLYALGTDLIAVSDTVTMVGSIIIAKTIITANKLCPLEVLNTFWISGTITTKPNIPYKTEGIPANNSTALEIISANFLGAISTINAAVNIPIGTPIINEPKVPNKVAKIIGHIPKTSALGIQSLPNKKLIKEYPLETKGVNPL